jgi:hypothetical protein
MVIAISHKGKERGGDLAELSFYCHKYFINITYLLGFTPDRYVTFGNNSIVSVNSLGD